MPTEPVLFPQLTVVNLAVRCAASSDAYGSVVINHVNESCLRLSAFEGDYRRYLHPGSEELFVVVVGTLVIDFADGWTLQLGPWDVITIPAGTVHRTRALPRVVNLCMERRGAETTFVGPPAAPPRYAAVSSDESPPVPQHVARFAPPMRDDEATAAPRTWREAP